MTTFALPQIDGSAIPTAARFTAYAYAYPHKTAYRHLDPPVALREAWSLQAKDSLFLYVHLPFCEMRCGFCNLFTLARPPKDDVAAYLKAFEIEARHTSDALGPATFTRMAIGGGTPTFLGAAQLAHLFQLLHSIFHIPFGQISLSVETSPRTCTLEKMRLLHDHGATRISIGVQSFIEAEVAATGRAQSNAWVHDAIGHIRTAGIPTLNVDLIYGLPDQTVASWLASLHTALTYRPEELYLYPLYIRPLTGIDRRDLHWSDIRAQAYTEGRDLLLAQGYTQESMRMFRAPHAPESTGPAYCCQDDGMVGLGCGARSYTDDLHYSREFAVGREGVKAILHEYLTRSADRFDFIDYGCRLNDHEQRRRYLIKSILRIQGLTHAAYQMRFGNSVLADFHELGTLIDRGFLRDDPAALCPTQKGLDHSDLIGPWLFSPATRTAMENFELH